MTRSLASYRLPAFWRDASVVAAALPEQWFDRLHRPRLGNDTLDILEAVGGVRSPKADGMRSSETRFHADLTIGTAVLSWAAATGIEREEDGTMDPVLRAPADRLLSGFGTPARMRSEILLFTDEMLLRSGPNLFEHYHFMEARQALVERISAER